MAGLSVISAMVVAVLLSCLPTFVNAYMSKYETENCDAQCPMKIISESVKDMTKRMSTIDLDSKRCSVVNDVDIINDKSYIIPQDKHSLIVNLSSSEEKIVTYKRYPKRHHRR